MGKGMKAAMKAGGAMTASGAYSAVAEKVGLKGKDVKGVFEAMMVVAADQLKQKWLVQDSWCHQSQVEEKESDCSSQGYQSILEGALRVQGEASIADRESAPHEKVQDGRELSAILSAYNDLFCQDVAGRGGRSHQTHQSTCTIISSGATSAVNP